MTRLDIRLPKRFLNEIGFLQTMQNAAKLPLDQEIVMIMKRLVPELDLSKNTTAPYVPQRWIGYWVERGVLTASDGRFKVTVPYNDAWLILVRTIRSIHYVNRNGPLPFLTTSGKPSHLLLHDAEAEDLYIESMEQGEAVLVWQPSQVNNG
jgi:hypothetical protein